MDFLQAITKIKKEKLIHYNTADKRVCSIFIYQLKKERRFLVKKNADKNTKTGSKQKDQPTMATEKLKYEVGQEMGISPKTKNKKS